MEPQFREGDFVIIWKFGKINTGDVVVADIGHRKLIKRVKRTNDNILILQGDSQHDRKVFSVRKGAVIGKVLWQIKRRS